MEGERRMEEEEERKEEMIYSNRGRPGELKLE